jgi:N-acetylglutamate synthase-like GNAT family acetyltransferase
MNSTAYHVRRATLEDLEALIALWTSMNFPATDLKNRLTEFQIAEDASGKVVGAVGFQVLQRHGLIHSEAFVDFAMADHVRPLLWGRIQALAMNHGVVRIWTRENAPFWTHNGLQPADASILERLPESWNRAPTGWLTSRLKDEDVIITLEKELALFKEAEKQNTAETLGQAHKVKQIVTAIGVVIALALIAAAVYLLLTHKPPGLLSP